MGRPEDTAVVALHELQISFAHDRKSEWHGRLPATKAAGTKHSSRIGDIIFANAYTTSSRIRRLQTAMMRDCSPRLKCSAVLT